MLTFCYSRRISYFQIEQQLFLRRIPFKSVAPEPIPSAENTLLMASPPYLVVQSADLLRGKSRVAFPNIAIQCVQHNKSIRVRISLPHEKAY